MMLVASLGGWLLVRCKPELVEKKYIVQILFVTAVIGLVAGGMEKSDIHLQTDGTIERNEPGEGDIEAQLEYTKEGEGEKEQNVPFVVHISEQQLSKEEREKLFTSAKQEIDTLFLGDNNSIDNITLPVQMPESLQEGMITATWSLDNYNVVNLDGTIQEECVEEKGTLIMATVQLYYQEYNCSYEFGFQVYPPEKTQKKTFLNKLSQAIAEEDKNHALEEQFQLPDSIGDYQLSWTIPESTTPVSIIGLGLIAIVGVTIGKNVDAQKKIKKRKMQMQYDYPEMVARLSLLLGAGMTMTGAWEKMVRTYQKQKENKRIMEREAYEEMLTTYYEMQDGIGELNAYERFGERCGVQNYRKLSSIIAQNLRKGTRGINELLEKEVDDAYQERSHIAKKYGEEAGTKLLLPMMMMLFVVIVILMVPACMSLQV